MEIAIQIGKLHFVIATVKWQEQHNEYCGESKNVIVCRCFWHKVLNE